MSDTGKSDGRQGKTPLMPRKPRTYSKVSSPTPPRPTKNYALFLTETEAELGGWGGDIGPLSLTPLQIFEEGLLGPLPLLLSVTFGYSFVDGVQSAMQAYQSDEILFAYKKDKQFRVLLQDSFNRTLSLPVHSPLTFCLEEGGSDKELSLSHVLCRHCLPVKLRFAREEELTFVMSNKETVDSAFFGTLLLTAVYDEPFYWCLSIESHGKVRSAPTVLPRNLLDVGFSPVTGIRGAADPAAKLQEFIDRFSHFAQKLRYHGDPFFQDLALVRMGPVQKVQPYIDEHTFVTVTVVNKSDESPPPYPCSRPALPDFPLSMMDPASRSTKSLEAGEEIEPPTPCWSQQDSLYEEPVSVWHRTGHGTMPRNDNSNNNTVAAGAAATSSFRTDNEHRSSPNKILPAPCRNAATLYSGSYVDISGHRRSCSEPTPPPLPPPRSFAVQGENESRSGSCADLRQCHRRARTPLPPSPVPSRAPTSHSAEADSGWEDHPRKATPQDPPIPAWKDTLDTLSVEDLTVKLKELGLQKYRKKFRNARIDGVLVQKLSEDTMKDEFGMRQLELIRLSAFIASGHVPKRTAKRSWTWRNHHSS